MLAARLPDDEGGDAADADHDGGDDVRTSPLVCKASSGREGREDEGEDGDHEDDSDNVELPEECDGHALGTVHLVGSFVVDESAGLLCSAVGNEERREDRDGTDGVDDAPHANTPSPGGCCEHSRRHITTHPCVDDERCCGNEGEEETRTKRGTIGDDYLDQQDDGGVANLVKNGSSTEAFNSASRGLDDCT